MHLSFDLFLGFHLNAFLNRKFSELLILLPSFLRVKGLLIHVEHFVRLDTAEQPMGVSNLITIFQGVTVLDLVDDFDCAAFLLRLKLSNVLEAFESLWQ